MAELRRDPAEDEAAAGNPVNADVFQNWVNQANNTLGKGGTLGPNGLPTGYKVDGDHVKQDSNLWGATWPGLVGMAGMGYAGLGAPGLSGLFGAGGGGSAASSSSTAALGPSTAGNMAATSAATSVPSSLAANGSHGIMASLFGGGGANGGGGGMFKSLDPTQLLFGALSLFGGPQQETHESFTEPGSITDPKQALYQALQANYRMGQGLSERKPVRMRSSYVQPTEPIMLNGIPFQIGGGMGRDPALDDPSLLEGRGVTEATKYDPFQSVIPQKTGKSR